MYSKYNRYTVMSKTKDIKAMGFKCVLGEFEKVLGDILYTF